MSEAYLTRVRISNFRTYGPGFQIDLPAGPGILVLNGMNGLGKTAFFEAIEWALTGSVQRLKGRLRANMQLDRRLTREAPGVAPGTHEVELTFSEGTVLRRNAVESPTSANLAGFLRRPEWKQPIRDVGTYLRLTHFLPQSSRERYLEHDEDEQWQLLKGPTGVERLEKFRALLNDRKALAAFAARIEHLQVVQENAKRVLADWASRLQQREALRAGVTASGACSPEQAMEFVEQMQGQLATLDEGGAPPTFGGTDAMQRLIGLQRALEIRRGQTAEMLQRLSTVEETLAEWEGLLTRRTAAQERQGVIEASLPTKLAAAETATAAVKDKRERVTRTESTVQESTRRAESLRLILNALRTLSEEIAPALQATQATLASASSRETQLAERMNLHAEERAVRENLQRSVREIRQTQASLEPSAARLTAALAARVAAEGALLSQGAVSEEVRLTRGAEAGAAQKIVATTEEVTRIQARLEAAQAVSDVIAKAVAEIAGHLHEQDTRCPVCEQVYSPGELRAKALAAAAHLTPGLEDLPAQLDLARGALTSANEALVEAQRVSGLAVEKLTAIVYAQEQAASQKLAVENDSFFPLMELDALTGWLEARRTELSERAAQLSTQFAALRPQEEFDRESQDLSTVRGQLAREKARSTANSQLLEGRRDECEAVLGVHLPLVLPLSRQDVTGLTAARNEAVRQIAELNLLAETLKAELRPLEDVGRAAQDDLRTSQVDQKNAADELQRISRASTRLVTSWRQTQLDGEPNRETLAQRRGGLLELRSRYESMLERQRVTAGGLLAWQRHEQLRRLEQEMRAAMESGGDADETRLQTRLEDSLRGAEAAVGRAQAASRRAAEISQRLQVSAETFSTAALAPLSDQISAFSRLVSPFGYQFHVRARHAPTQVRAELAISDPTRNAGRRGTKEHDPAMWLSEGQASALGLCVLLGASTAYRWARWPALLLDDPLQNTDLIHAAAFVDIIRGLMKDSGYQMFVSTHDGQEADFLIRRCAQLDLPITRMDLLGLTPDGLRYKVRTE